MKMIPNLKQLQEPWWSLIDMRCPCSSIVHCSIALSFHKGYIISISMEEIKEITGIWVKDHAKSFTFFLVEVLRNSSHPPLVMFLLWLKSTRDSGYVGIPEFQSSLFTVPRTLNPLNSIRISISSRWHSLHSHHLSFLKDGMVPVRMWKLWH